MRSAVLVQLDVNFTPEDLARWYHAESGRDVIIMIRACPVRISRCPREHVCWWPEGGRRVTEPLEKAMRRLQTLQETKRIEPRVTRYNVDANDIHHAVAV